MADTSPLCFVLMPFGRKADPTGGPPIDFDRIYAEAIVPAIHEAGLRPIRADEERGGTVIHRAMFERLLLCEYALADLTTANANVFYELGIRHTARPRSTLAMFAKGHPLPFDVRLIPALPYDLGAGNSFEEQHATALRTTLVDRLGDLRIRAIQETRPDSPVFQLLGEWKPAPLSHRKTDVFRDQVRLRETIRDELAAARSDPDEGTKRMDAVRASLGHLDLTEAGSIVDLLLSYRAIRAWDSMVELFDEMPETLKRQVMVREQLAFALNRRAVRDTRARDQARALEILEEVRREQGPSPETCGLIGRIHKDRWEAAAKDAPLPARAHLRRAIEAYCEGFDADTRDAYPGVNAVTLLELLGSEEALQRRDRLLPVVRYAVERRTNDRSVDYWDFATMLELEVLAGCAEAAEEHVGEALAALREPWEAETTARNLRLIEAARSGRGEEAGWIGELAGLLEARA